MVDPHPAEASVRSTLRPWPKPADPGVSAQPFKVLVKAGLGRNYGTLGGVETIELGRIVDEDLLPNAVIR